MWVDEEERAVLCLKLGVLVYRLDGVEAAFCSAVTSLVIIKGYIPTPDPHRHIYQSLQAFAHAALSSIQNQPLAMRKPSEPPVHISVAPIQRNRVLIKKKVAV